MNDRVNLASNQPGWKVAPLPPTEVERLAALRALAVLDSPPELEFDALVQVASLICGTPVSLLSLIDTERQWFKANHGLAGVSETPRDQAFCAHAILQDDLFVVPDAAVDERFAGNPLVTAEAGIRFYAGAPVRLSDGHLVGTLCVIDRQPRQLDAAQRAALGALALAASRALEGRFAGMALARRNAFLDTTLNAIADAVLTVDDADRLTWLNPAAEELLGCRATAVTGRSVESVLPLRGASMNAGWGAFLETARQGKRLTLSSDAELERQGAVPVAVSGSLSCITHSEFAGTTRSDGVVLVLRDASAERHASSEILHRATHDAS